MYAVAIIVLLALPHTISATKLQTKKSVRIIEFTDCSGVKSSGRLENFYLTKNKNGEEYFNCDWDFTTSAKAIGGYLAVYKCTSPARSDCEFFIRLTLDNMCDYFQHKNELYSPVFAAVKPPLRCPLRKGVYRIRNATWDMEKLFQYEPHVPLTKYIWRYRHHMTKLPEKSNYFCYEGAIELFKTKHRVKTSM